MLEAENIYNLDVEKRKIQILENANILESDDDLARAKKLSLVIDCFIEDYFSILISNDKNNLGGSVLSSSNLDKIMLDKVNTFKSSAIKDLKNAHKTIEERMIKPENLYQFVGAVKLELANKVTRTMTTKMGSLWEDIANISPYSINPELEFDIKIKGIDLISQNFDNKKIEYQQVKTKQNTLTGSQKERSIQELSIHKNPVFCACFSLGKWTFNDSEIIKVSGKDFWHRIGIDYNIFEKNVRILILDLEKEFLEM